jgi:hypothetical protein
MAITDIQISEELETGAPSIRYKGKEGPRPPMQSQEEMMIAKQVWDAMGPEEKGQLEIFRSGVWKQILQQAQQDEMQGQGGIGSLGPGDMEQGPGRIPARFGGDMEELSMEEKIKFAPEWSRDATTVPSGIETLDEKETMKIAGPDWYTKRIEHLMFLGYSYDEAGEIAFDNDKYYEIVGDPGE